MPGQPSKNSNRFFDKLSNIWKRFDKIIIAVSVTLGAIVTIINYSDEIIEKLFPDLPSDIKEGFENFESKTDLQRKQIYENCEDYAAHCMNEYIKIGENLKSSNELQSEIVDEIYSLNNKIGDDEVFNICLDKVNEFLSESTYESATVSENGFRFYIKLFKKFEISYPDEIIEIFAKMRLKIDSNSNLDRVVKNTLINKID